MKVISLRGQGVSPVNPTREIRLRCPGCRHQATLDPFPNINDLQLGNGIILGQRRCPNPECFTHIFFGTQGATLIVSYPPERIDFDATGIPEPVVAALEEAISCHANKCHVAAAIMVRKTLEELCRDRGATGKTLKDRIAGLQSKVVLPKELLDGMDDLRLLGNDAAHVESKVFSEVGQEEVDIGVLFAKEILKAVYQYSNILDRLRALKEHGQRTPDA